MDSFLKEKLIDTVNYNLIKFILNDFTGDYIDTKEKKELLEELDTLDTITFDFYEEREERDNSVEHKKNLIREEIRKGKIEEETELWLRRLRDEAFVDINLDRL